MYVTLLSETRSVYLNRAAKHWLITMSHIIRWHFPETKAHKGLLDCFVPGSKKKFYGGKGRRKERLTKYQLLTRPRLNCNYGKLLFYIRYCVTIERAIFGPWISASATSDSAFSRLLLGNFSAILVNQKAAFPSHILDVLHRRRQLPRFSNPSAIVT